MGGTPPVWVPCTGCTPFSRQSSGFHSPGWGTASPRRGAGRSLRTGFPGIPAVPSRRSHPCLHLFPPSGPWGRWARWAPQGHRVPLDLHGEGGAFPAAPEGASRPSGCSSGPSSVPRSPSACSPGNPSHRTTPRLFWQWMGHRRTRWHRPWVCPSPCRCTGLSWAALSSCSS